MQGRRRVLITGGARGVGRGISLAFLKAGDEVLICGRNLPDEMPVHEGNAAQFLECDVRDPAQVDALFERIASQNDRLDVLVNNAGGAPFALAADVSPRFSESIIRLNLIAPLYLAQKANAMMQTQDRGGAILFIGSISALRPSPGTAAYGAAKAGILSLVQSLAVEWAPRVRVMAISPGLVETEQSALHYGDEKGLQRVAATIPAGRLAQPEEIGDACVWMSGPQASYASGSNLVMQGAGERPSFMAAAGVNQSSK